MAYQQPLDMENLPEEIQDQIIRSVPIIDLPSVMLVSQAFSRLVKPHLYHSVHYFGPGTLPDCYLHVKGNPGIGHPPHNFVSGKANNPAYDPINSARTFGLAKLLRTITEKMELSSQIHVVGFSSGTAMERHRDVYIDLEAETEHLSILISITSKLVLTDTVTSVDIIYPDS